MTKKEHDKLNVRRNRRIKLDDLIRLTDESPGTCPTCGQSVAGLVADRAALVAERDALALWLTEVWAKEKAIREASVAQQRWDDWHTRYVRDMAELDADERDMAVEQEAAPAVAPEELRKVVDVAAELEAACKELAKRHEDARVRTATLEGRRAQMQAQLKEARSEVAQYSMKGAMLQHARETLAALAAAQAERDRAEGEAAAMLHTLEADEALRARLEAAEAAMAPVRTLRAGAEEVLAVVHRNAAPRLVAEAQLDRLIDAIDELLELFGVDFRVVLGEGLGFVAEFTDGRIQPAGRLSPGQQAVLALAFWVGVNSMFARQLGFLCLDEPTASLDQTNLGALAAALKKLQALSESLGLQTLLVTHEQALAPLFDEVLQLAPP